MKKTFKIYSNASKIYALKRVNFWNTLHSAIKILQQRKIKVSQNDQREK